MKSLLLTLSCNYIRTWLRQFVMDKHRNIHIGPEAKQAIEDADADYYEKQNLERVK